MRAATNPGPSWIKEKWGILPDPKLYATKQQAIIASMQGERIYYVGTHPDRVFIPSYMNDNEYVNWKEYEPVLKNLDPYTRKQLVEGNWDVRADSRFKRTWAKYYILRANDIVIDGEVIHFSRLKKIFTTVDPAATVKAGPVDGDTTKGAPSWTVISTWGLTTDDRLVWLDMQRFRKEIPDIIDCLERVHNKYQPSFHKIEYTGLGIGVAQFAEAAGLPVKKNVKKTDKIENSTSAMMFMKFGQIYFPGNAHWLDEAENEVFGWTGKPDEEDDIIDTLSDAATELTQRNAKETVTLINRHKSVAKFLDFRTIEQAKVAATKGRFIGFGF
jgi:predicted phage terminase large subunit-like protein